MSYAIFKTGNKQYKVQTGDIIDIDKIDAKVDSTTSFDQVLFTQSDNATQVGTPLVSGAAVKAKVLSQFRDKKVIAFKFKRRKGYHKTKGSRKHLTRIQITSI